jgi:hypothetical protein
VLHLRDPRAFPAVLTRQLGRSGGIVQPIAMAVVAAEVVLGLAGLGLAGLGLGLFGAGGTPARYPLYGAAALYGLFALYGAALLRWRPAAPCGCSRTDHPVNVWIPVRAAVLGVGTLYAATAPADILPWSATTEFLVAAVASAALVVLAWSLPSALAVDAPVPAEPFPGDPSWTS